MKFLTKRVNMRYIIVAVLIMALPLIATAENRTENNYSKTQKSMKTLNKFEFPQLPYAYDALEPFIDKMTMEIHYSRHHKAYFDNFVAAIKGTEMESKTIEEIFANISKYPAAVRNNGGGFYNHVIYWESMKLNSGKLSAKLQTAINNTFGSIDELKKLFLDAGKTRFGSGWSWLSVNDKGELFVSSTPNQDNPLMDIAEKKGTPILAMDVWEHAYYLNYQNRRPEYIDAFWHLVDWSEVAGR